MISFLIDLSLLHEKEWHGGVIETPNLHILHISFQQKKKLEKGFTFVKALKGHDTGDLIK